MIQPYNKEHDKGGNAFHKMHDYRFTPEPQMWKDLGT